MLPTQKYKEGYTLEEVKKICRNKKIPLKSFHKAFGIQTGIIINGECIVYECDVKRALRILGYSEKA